MSSARSSSRTARGTIAAAGPEFARLVDLCPDRPPGQRFVELLELGDRPAACDAIEQVLSGSDGEAIDALLLRSDASPLEARIAIAPLADGTAVAVAALLVTPGGRAETEQRALGTLPA